MFPPGCVEWNEDLLSNSEGRNSRGAQLETLVKVSRIASALFSMFSTLSTTTWSPFRIPGPRVCSTDTVTFPGWRRDRQVGRTSLKDLGVLSHGGAILGLTAMDNLMSRFNWNDCLSQLWPMGREVITGKLGSRIQCNVPGMIFSQNMSATYLRSATSHSFGTSVSKGNFRLSN